MEEQKDEKLWRRARAIAAFKRNLFGYVVINVFLWAVWAFTAGRDYFKDTRGIPWPAWITLGWGLGIAFHYFRAYKGSNADIAGEEYERLKRGES
jgi:hypothetical protein